MSGAFPVSKKPLHTDIDKWEKTMPDYTLTITVPVTTDLEPVYSFKGQIIGFNTPTGRLAPWVVFENDENQDIYAPDKLLELGMDVYDWEGFEREFIEEEK